ncbi:MAG: glutamate--tRNA ligase [Pseudomonadota bacterium]|nr:glutamate--tRNA ligase [Pseudomonadota bacterium]
MKTRFAPSPTGRLHLGNLRTALFNYLLARSVGGRFLLRIEDTDAARSTLAHQQTLLDDLRWLGLQWDEGPGCGASDAGPFRQSERGAIYAGYYERLLDAGAAYPCFCSDQALASSRRAQLAAGLPPRYPGTCRGLAPAQAQTRLAAGEAAALRLAVAGGERLVWDDLVHGPQQVQTEVLGDFVIRRRDGSAAFLFSNALDDALMGVTDVLRGEDHLANTPRQLLVLREAGLPPPRYGHLPLVLGADAAPLSKRRGDAGLAALRDQGVLPAALVNYLARFGHRLEDDALLPLAELAARFSPARLARAGARYDPAQLLHWQHRALGMLSLPALRDWAGPALEGVPAARAEALLGLVRGNVRTRAEVADWAQRLCLPGAPDEAAPDAPPALFAALLAAWQRHGAALPAIAADVAEVTGRRGRALYHPLRLALTGREDGPELRDILALMPPAVVQARLERALQKSSESS